VSDTVMSVGAVVPKECAARTTASLADAPGYVRETPAAVALRAHARLVSTSASTPTTSTTRAIRRRRWLVVGDAGRS
jgi:hypothetical protein